VACFITGFGLTTRSNARIGGPRKGTKRRSIKDHDALILDKKIEWWEWIPSKTRAILSALVLIAVLLFENFFIWVISSTYTESHSRPYPTPLRDNGQILMRYLLSSTDKASSQLQTWRDALIGLLFISVAVLVFKINVERYPEAVRAANISGTTEADALKLISKYSKAPSSDYEVTKVAVMAMFPRNHETFTLPSVDWESAYQYEAGINRIFIFISDSRVVAVRIVTP